MKTYKVIFESGKTHTVKAFDKGNAKLFAGYAMIKQNFCNEVVKEVIEITETEKRKETEKTEGES